MRIYELIPTNGRKGFYGKAKVVIDNKGNKTLYSYDIPIITKSSSGKLTKLYNGWTTTTGNHIKSFCGLNKKDFMNLSVAN